MFKLGTGANSGPAVFNDVDYIVNRKQWLRDDCHYSPLNRNGDLVVAMGNHSFIFEQQGQILAKIFSKVEIKDVLCKLGSTNFYLGSLWFAIARAARPVSPRAGMVA